MLLNFTNGEPFATGAVSYRLPQDGADATRITIGVEIEENLTEAIVDTATPYIICSPSLAKLLNLDPASGMKANRMLMRGIWVEGRLYRINISLLADEGEALSIEAPAFVPDLTQDFTEGFLPRSFLGWTQCLESVRFAVDSFTETFYFGN